MAAASTPAPVRAPEPKPEREHDAPRPSQNVRKYATPALVVLLAGAIFATISWNSNAWEGGRIDQTTDDAYVHGDITPLSTKVSGIVRDVKVADYQAVHKGDLIAELEDSDYQAQVAQGSAAVEAAKPPSRTMPASATCRMPGSTKPSQESIRRKHRSPSLRRALTPFRRTWCGRAPNAPAKKLFCKHTRLHRSKSSKR